MGDMSNNGNGHQPDWLPPLFDSIPVEIRELRQFLVWRAVWRKNKWTKVPYNVRDGSSGSSTNAQTWSTFDEAKAAYERGSYSGVGIAMSAPLAGVDLDKCIDPDTGKITDWAMVIVRAFDTYTERSPSGTGLRILFKGELPGPGLNRDVRGCHLEIYDKGRYLTLTGHHIEGTPKTIEPRQEAASQFYQWILDQTETSKQSGERPVIDPNQKGKDLTDSEVMECAMNAANSAKFEKLWDGDMSDYVDSTHPEGNPSRADAAMVGLLCYHSLDDEQVARLWKASGLFRDKLESRKDYIPRTIRFIRGNQTDVCAKALPNKQVNASNVPDDRLASAVVVKVASEFDDIVLLILKEYEPIITEEDKLTLLALISVFGGRKTAAVSRGLLAKRIRKLDDNGKVASSKALDQFGGRRLMSLKKALKRSIKVPVLTMIEHSRKRGFDKRTQKPKASRYSLDLTIFREALYLADFYFDEWCKGKPRFKEWQGDDSYQPKPNKGKCREVAARQIAHKYRQWDEPEESRSSKPDSDAVDFKKWIDSEKTMFRAAAQWADAVEDLGKTTMDKRVHAGRVLDRTKEILLQDDRQERRRKVLKLVRDTERENAEASFIDEGMLLVVDDDPQKSESELACSHLSVNTNGDTPLSLFEQQLAQFQARGEISEDLPRPAIWHNKDYDEPKTVIGVFDQPSDDGKLYVRTQEGAGGLACDEIEFLPAAATTGDPLVDALLEDEMEAIGLTK
jgi:hypothetical protein